MLKGLKSNIALTQYVDRIKKWTFICSFWNIIIISYNIIKPYYYHIICIPSWYINIWGVKQVNIVTITSAKLYYYTFIINKVIIECQ